MGYYISQLCAKCKRPIEHPPYRRFEDLESDITYLYHDTPDCWGKAIYPVVDEFVRLMIRLKMRRLA